MYTRGLLSAQFPPAAAAAPSPPLATAIVGGVLAARGEGLGGGVGDVEPGVRHREHADIFAHLEHGRLGYWQPKNSAISPVLRSGRDCQEEGVSRDSIAWWCAPSRRCAAISGCVTCTCRRRRRAARGASCFDIGRSLRDGGCLTCGRLAQDRQFLSFVARRPADGH